MGDSSTSTGNVMIVAIEPGKRQTVQTILEADCQEVKPGVNINELIVETKRLEETAAFKAKALEEMDVLSKKLDRTPSQRDYDRDEDTTLCSRRIMRGFHGWNNFVDAAGLERRRPGVYKKGIPKRQKAELRRKECARQKEVAKKTAINKARRIWKKDKNISKHKMAELLGHDYRTIERWFDGWDNFWICINKKTAT
jgi:hypothetical protein